MKIRYRDSQERQIEQSPSQRELREAVPQRSHLRSYTLVLLLAALGIVMALWWYQSGRVHTYGVVTTGMNLFHAPVRSTVRAVHVEPGDQVSADQLLFVLDSSEAATELGQVKSELDRKRQLLDDLKLRTHIDHDPQRSRDLRTAGERISQIERELTALDDARQLAIIDLNAQRGLAEQRRSNLRNQRERQQQRSESMVYLVSHGAATRSERDRHRLEHSRLDLELAEVEAQLLRIGRLESLGTETQNHRRQALVTSLEAARTHAESLAGEYRALAATQRNRERQIILDTESRIASLEAQAAHLEKLAGPTEVRALADGVVMEVAVSVGSTVAKDGIIMSVAGTGKLWISAFIPADEAHRVKIGDHAHIHPTAGGGPLLGTVTATGGLEYKVHPSLRSRFADFSAVYARVDLDGTASGLIPGNVVEIVIED